jgi:tripartite-type tricarboxylate transporter receptor subunit TctC
MVTFKARDIGAFARRIAGMCAVVVASLLTAAALFSSPVQAQEWPTRPIRLIVAYGPGGMTDTTARLVAVPMGQYLGQPVVVENRPGASGAVAAAFVASTTPDGYTILEDATSHSVNPSLLKGLSFDYRTAFAPISQISTVPHLLVVRPESGMSNLADLVDFARQNPGKVSFASSGTGTGPHIAGVLLGQIADLNMLHVSYRGGGQLAQSIISGDVNFAFATAPSVLSLVQDARLRALAVTTTERVQAFPGVPTVAEQGYSGFSVNE